VVAFVPGFVKRVLADSTRIERLVLGVVVAGWIVVLGSVLGRHLFVSHDSLSNNSHVWWISRQLWNGHGLPMHMPMLAGGRALAYPYAFIPWTSAALLRPLIGDWIVTWWLVIGFAAVVVFIVRAFPELRRGYAISSVLVCPPLVMAVLVGQVPFLWGMALLFASIDQWRRHRTWWAAILLGLAIGTHPAVVGPIALLLVVARFSWEPAKRALLVRVGIALLVSIPADVMVAKSPAFEQSSALFRLSQVARITATRGVLLLVPVALVLFIRYSRRWLVPAVLVLLVVFDASSAFTPMNRYAWAAPWRSADESISRFIDSPAFQPDATYRVLGFSDGRMSMYRLIQEGSRLDGEFFPESQARRSWDTRAEYEKALTDRHVDYVVAWSSYDSRWRTNEHEWLRRMAAAGSCASGRVRSEVVFTDPAYEVYRLSPCGA